MLKSVNIAAAMAACVISGGILAQHAYAVDSANTGDWSAPGTWTPFEPTALDIANINNGHNVTVTQLLETALRLDIGSTANASGALTVNSGSLSVGGANASAPSIRVAQAAGSTGSLTMTGGVVTLNAAVANGGFAVGDLILGDLATSNGTMTMSGGTFTVSDEVFVALGGTGTLTHSGGLIETAAVGGRGFIVGFFNGSNGTLNLSGTGAATGASFITGFDPGSVGNVTQTGGTASARSFMLIARQGTSTYTHSAGAISVITGNGDVVIGESGAGIGTYNLSGTGTVTTSDDFIVGNAGTAKGTVNQTGGAILLGSTAALGQDYIVGAGALTAGVVNHSAGSMTSTFLGVGTNGKGTYNLSGTGIVTTRTLMIVGQNLTAAAANASGVVQSGTSVLTTAGLIVGERGTGSYAISGGTLNVTNLHTVGGPLGPVGNLIVGRDGGGVNIGSGQFTQTGGNVNVTTSVFLGDFDDSNGVYSISAGTLAVGGNFNVGGALASNAPADAARTGDQGQALGAKGTLIVSGSGSVIQVGGSFRANPADRTRPGTANAATLVFEMFNGTGVSRINVGGAADLDGAVIDVDTFSFTPAPLAVYDLIAAGGGFGSTGTGTTQNTGTGEGYTLAAEDVGTWTLRVVPGATGGEVLQAVYVPEPASLTLLAGVSMLAMRRRSHGRQG